MTRPLRSTRITRASSLLRDGPPLCPATGTQLLEIHHLLELFLSPPIPPGVTFRTTGSRVPNQSPDQAHATYTPDTARAVDRYLPDSSRRQDQPSVLMSSTLFDTSPVVRFRSSSWPTPDALTGTPFPHRFPPRLLTGAVCGGFEPSPARRPWRTYLHLWFSYAQQGRTRSTSSDPPSCARGTRSCRRPVTGSLVRSCVRWRAMWSTRRDTWASPTGSSASRPTEDTGGLRADRGPRSRGRLGRDVHTHHGRVACAPERTWWPGPAATLDRIFRDQSRVVRDDRRRPRNPRLALIDAFEGIISLP
jgi:hypothetical protein